jgi:ubiquinone/menaquinone biosynthesis C-methylase UbiE
MTPTSDTSMPRPFPASRAWILDNPLSRWQAKSYLRRLPIRTGMRVVDIGSGPGRLTLHIARIVGAEGEVLALDVQPAMLAMVERRARRQRLSNVRTLHAAAGSGALSGQLYDLALLVGVLGEIPVTSRRAAVQEIADALEPGGALVVTEVIFDPDRLSRETVLDLASPAGLGLESEERTWYSVDLLFRKTTPET